MKTEELSLLGEWTCRRREGGGGGMEGMIGRSGTHNGHNDVMGGGNYGRKDGWPPPMMMGPKGWTFGEWEGSGRSIGGGESRVEDGLRLRQSADRFAWLSGWLVV